MKILTIPQKQSNSGSIHDLASDKYDRMIEFRRGAKYAVVDAAYYGGDYYTAHKTGATAAAASRKLAKAAWSHKIVDAFGNLYDVDGDRLRKNGEPLR